VQQCSREQRCIHLLSISAFHNFSPLTHALLALDPCTSKTMHALVCSGIQHNRRILRNINQRSCPSLFSDCGKPDDSAVKGLHQTMPFYPRVRLKKVQTDFVRFSLFFSLKTAFFLRFPRFFPHRVYVHNVHRGIPEKAKNTVFLTRKFGVCYHCIASSYRISTVISL
jgi:hypothetical protein